MILILAKLLTKLFKLKDIQKAQRIAVFVIIGAAALILLVAGLWIRSCVGKSVKLNNREIQEINNAIEDRNDGKLREKLAEIQVKEQVIVGTVSNSAANTANAVQQAKEEAAKLNTQELADALEKYK